MIETERLQNHRTKDNKNLSLFSELQGKFDLPISTLIIVFCHTCNQQGTKGGGLLYHTKHKGYVTEHIAQRTASHHARKLHHTVVCVDKYDTGVSN